MPKQEGPLRIVGTINGITYYKMKGKFYKKMKSPINRERVKTDPAYKELIERCKKFAKGTKLASVVYHQMPDSHRKHENYLFLMIRAQKMMVHGKSETETLNDLKKLVLKLLSK